MTRELKLIFYTCTLYVSFIYWGYLQEKITSSSYACESGTDNDALRWNFPRKTSYPLQWKLIQLITYQQCPTSTIMQCRRLELGDGGRGQLIRRLRG